jgi:hypothetical protein
METRKKPQAKKPGQKSGKAQLREEGRLFKD